MALADWSAQIAKVAGENQELTKELEVLQVYMKNVVDHVEVDGATVGPGLVSAVVRSEVQPAA